VHLAPGATLCGLVSVGDGAMIATGATVLPRIKIGQGATVGGGAVVVKDVPDYAVVVGNPARVIRIESP
jgi:acetyltransferase-like isoleucine patch superfamily enzyme